MTVQLLTGCLDLGVWLYLSEPQFCHLGTGVKNRAFRNPLQDLEGPG